MGLWLAAPCAAHSRAEPLGPRSHTGSLLPLFPTSKGNSGALPLALGSPCPTPLLPVPAQPLSFLTTPHRRIRHHLAAAGGEEGPCPLGCSRQARQEGRVQTSCGWSLQPPPALALAFLQADVDARHREVVCALVRLNKVPARHAASQGCPRPPSSLRHTKTSARQGHGLQAVGTQLAAILRWPWQSRAETLEPSHTEHTEGPFPGRSILLGSTCPLPLDITAQSAHRLVWLCPQEL